MSLTAAVGQGLGSQIARDRLQTTLCLLAELIEVEPPNVAIECLDGYLEEDLIGAYFYDTATVVVDLAKLSQSEGVAWPRLLAVLIHELCHHAARGIHECEPRGHGDEFVLVAIRLARALGLEPPRKSRSLSVDWSSQIWPDTLSHYPRLDLLPLAKLSILAR